MVHFVVAAVVGHPVLAAFAVVTAAAAAAAAEYASGLVEPEKTAA